MEIVIRKAKWAQAAFSYYYLCMENKHIELKCEFWALVR